MKSKPSISHEDSIAETKLNWFVYMIRTQKGKLYTGISTDVVRRLLEHQEGNKGAKFFRSDGVDALLLLESGYNRSSASIREAEIKKLSRLEKLRLIHLQSPCAFIPS